MMGGLSPLTTDDLMNEYDRAFMARMLGCHYDHINRAVYNPFANLQAQERIADLWLQLPEEGISVVGPYSDVNCTTYGEA